MGPLKETKQERKYTPPSFIDENFIKTLSKEKQEYWANRILGRPGQGEKIKPKVVSETTKNAATYLDNDGNMVLKNREVRRQKPPHNPKYTKANHARKKGHK